jgi:hypothetical protein
MRTTATLPAGMHVAVEGAGIVLRWPGDLALGASGGPWTLVDVGGDLRLDGVGAVGRLVVGGTLFVRGTLSAQRVEAGAVDAQDAVLNVQQLQVRGTLGCARTEVRVQDARVGAVVFGPGVHGVVARWTGPTPRLPCAVEGPWIAAAPTSPALSPAPRGPRPTASPRWPGMVTREAVGPPATSDQRARAAAQLAALSSDSPSRVEASFAPGADVDALALALLRAYRDGRVSPAPTWFRAWVYGDASGA